MSSTAADQDLLARMKQRELHLKTRQRAANAIAFEIRRYRGVLVVVSAVIGAIVLGAIFVLVEFAFIGRFGFWRGTILVLIIGALFGGLLAQNRFDSESGRHRLAAREAVLVQKHRAELSAGRRWLEFYYNGEDIAPYIPEILYAMESEHRFDTVQAALAAVKEWHYQVDSAKFRQHVHELFTSIASQTNMVAISSTDESGHPSTRMMNFATTDRIDLWYLTTAPDSPKVPELDHGPIAVITPPNKSGGTISSNRVELRRSDKNFLAVADLYRAQVPGYVEGMTADEQQHELVYELTFQSAKVETWQEREVVVFSAPASEPSEGT